MIRCLASKFHFRNTIEIVEDSNPLTLCTRRDERCPSSLPLLGAVARLVRLELQRHLEEVNSQWNTSTLRVSQNGTALSLPARQEHV